MTGIHTTTEPLRVDIWLWAARFYKTRSIAAAAVSAGHATVNGVRCKRAKTIKPGDTVCINRAGELTEVVVQQLSVQRGPAIQAQLLYQETEASRSRSELLRAQRASNNSRTPAPTTRPTKRERRALDNWTKLEH